MTPASFTYYRCTTCRLIFVHPLPANLPRYYPADYHSFPRSLEELRVSASVHESYKLDILRQFVPRGTVLELGPGVGGFALLASRAGYDMRVIEVDQRCCDFIRSVLGIEAVHALDEVAALAQTPQVDAIVLWQVLEHLPQPFRLLEVAAARLKPGGTLIVAMPNPESFQFRILGGRWVHLDAPRHVVLIPRRLLLQEAARLGLSPLLVTTRDAGSIAWNRFGWEYSLPNLFPDAWDRGAAMRRGKRLGTWLRLIDDREGIGAAYTAVLRKPGA